MAIEQNLINAKQLLKSLAQKIPQTIQDLDKQVYIGMDIIANLTMEEKTLIKNLVNAILLKMRKYNASDIELGGDGAKSNIWLWSPYL